MKSSKPIHKPIQVRSAVGLFYLALSLSLIQPFIASSAMARPPAPVVLAMAVAAVVTVFLIEFVSIGRNWARIVYLVLTILALPLSLLAFRVHLQHSWLAAVCTVAQLAAHGVGLWLVFSAPGRAWFRAGQKQGRNP